MITSMTHNPTHAPPAPMIRATALLVCGLALVGGSGCTPDDSFGQFRASGFAPAFAETCVAEAFPLDLTLFGSDTRFDTTTIRMRSQGTTPYGFNQAMLIIHDAAAIEEAVGQAAGAGVELELLEPEGARCISDADCASGACNGTECIAPPTEDTLFTGPLARVEISLDNSCALRPGSPGVPVSLTVRDCSILITDFEPRDDGLVMGRLAESGCRLIDARTGATVADNVSGNWRMLAHEGPPYQDFFNAP